MLLAPRFTMKEAAEKSNSEPQGLRPPGEKTTIIAALKGAAPPESCPPETLHPKAVPLPPRVSVYYG
jgi:hypothetical protein